MVPQIIERTLNIQDDASDESCKFEQVKFPMLVVPEQEPQLDVTSYNTDAQLGIGDDQANVSAPSLILIRRISFGGREGAVKITIQVRFKILSM